MLVKNKKNYSYTLGIFFSKINNGIQNRFSLLYYKIQFRMFFYVILINAGVMPARKNHFIVTNGSMASSTSAEENKNKSCYFLYKNI